MGAPRPRVLVVGEVVALERGPDADVFEVEAVNPSVAVLRQLHVKPVAVEFAGRSFHARKGRRTTVAPTAFVYRREDVDGLAGGPFGEGVAS